MNTNILDKFTTYTGINAEEEKEMLTMQKETQEEVKLTAPTTEESVVEDATDYLEEKMRMIRLPNENNQKVVEKLYPLRYPEYDELWLTSYNNNWKPEAISMKDDKRQWYAPKGDPNYIDENTRHMIKTNFIFFAPAEDLIEDNIMSAMSKFITMPEVKNYLSRLAFEESIHSRTFMWSTKELSLDPDEIYGQSEHIPCIEAMHEFMKTATTTLSFNNINLRTIHGRKEFMKGLLAQIIMEGVLFYAGFAMNLSLNDRGLMKNLNQQYEYVMRDETSHLLCMRLLFNHLKDNEWPDVWDKDMIDFCRDKFIEAVALQTDYINYCLREEYGGVPGIRAIDCIDYTKYLVNRRLEYFGIDNPYPEVQTNPFPALEKQIDLPVTQNFFEGHVTDYVDDNSAEGFDF